MNYLILLKGVKEFNNILFDLYDLFRRGGRVVEGARLESVYTGNRIVGSNPTLSAINLSFLIVKYGVSIIFIFKTIYLRENNLC